MGTAVRLLQILEGTAVAHQQGNPAAESLTHSAVVFTATFFSRRLSSSRELPGSEGPGPEQAFCDMANTLD